MRSPRIIAIVFLCALTMTGGVTAASANCGQYMYPDKENNGKCVDARNKGSSHWMRKMDWNFNSSRW